MTPYDRARLNLLTAYKAVAAFASNRYAVKSLSSASYGKELAAIGDKATDEQKTRDRIAALILLYALWAWEDGVKESGADPTTPVAQTQGQQATTAWVAQQTQYSAGLASAFVRNQKIQDAKEGETIYWFPAGGGNNAEVVTNETKQSAAAAIEDRVGQWVESLNAQRLQGMADGAKLEGGDDPICTWILGPTDEHCHSDRGMMGCYELSRQKPEPLSYFVTAGLIPRSPANPEISCHGFRCLCSLVRASDGVQVM